MVISYMPRLWKKDPGSLARPNGSRRDIRGGPLLDLAALQALVSDGTLGEDKVWVATDRCEKDLQNWQWNYRDVLHMLTLLRTTDFKKAQWCQVKGGEMYPCDGYVLRYDCERRARNVRGLEVYMKFSVTEEGQMNLVLVSCHGSR